MSWFVFISLAWLIMYLAPKRWMRVSGVAVLLLILFLGLGNGRR